MKFLLTYEQDPKQPPPTPQHLAKIGAYTEKMVASGKVLMTGGLVRPTTGTRLRCESGKLSVVDGPFCARGYSS
jgi:hypothetical protein